VAVTDRDDPGVRFMSGRFREQAEACARLGSPMYADLLDRCARDIEAGGPVREVLTGHEKDPGPSALALRLAGSVHRLVLEGRAPELAAFYPSVGGRFEPAGCWEAFIRLLRAEPDDVRTWLHRAPQTNEVGRATALMGGLMRIGETYRHPVLLREIGSSGGLNLRADRFAYVQDGQLLQGPADSPLRLVDPWRGPLPARWPDLRIVDRLGSDLYPVDVGTPVGRLTLASYVWPDQQARLDRLRSAFEVAAAHPAEVRTEDAVSFLRGLELADGAITVLWHSVMWQYLTARDQAAATTRVEELGRAATRARPFAHLYAEPMRRTPDHEHEFLVVLRLWPGGERRVLGTTAPHGLPTTWE
jgi:hypothetical protein